MISDATKHMTPHRASFDSYDVISPFNVHLDDDSVVQAFRMDCVVVEVLEIRSLKKMRMKYVLHVSKLQANLLFVSKFVSSVFKVQFNVDGCTLKTSDVIAKSLHEDNLFQVIFTKIFVADSEKVVQSSSKNKVMELWHRSLGHLNAKSLSFLQSMV